MSISKFFATIEQTIDDGREQDDSSWNSQGNPGSVITIGNAGGSLYSAGLRFRNVRIPRNAKIILARIKIRPAVTDSSEPDTRLIIKGIKETDTKPFSQSSRPSRRNKTVNGVSWHIVKKWEVHEWAQTPNLNLIVEELVAQSDWKSGNAMAFAITDNGSPTNQAETFWDKSKGDGYQARLEIWYTNKSVTIAYLVGNDRDGVETGKSVWQSSPSGNVITMGNDGSAVNDAGFIFSGVNLPRYANVIGAYLLLTQADQNNKYPNLLIKGFAEDAAAPFSSDGSNRPSLRQKTNAEIEWTIGHSENGIFVGEHWSAESVYESPDLKEIIQEIIDRDGWQGGNKIGLVLESLCSWSGQYKLVWDYVKNSGEFTAKLVIVWDEKRTFRSSQKDLAKYEKANCPAYIIVHHSATPGDSTHFNTIKNNHIGIGWGDIAYHHWIAGTLDGDGLHILGRPENKIGAHCDTQKMNYRSIGICICGDFHPSAGNEQPSSQQLATLQSLLDDIRQRRGISRSRVLGHREVPDSTNCPGDNLLAYVRRYRATGRLLP